MRQEYIFTDNQYKEDFEYVYSPICKTFGEFIQEEDHLRNFTACEGINRIYEFRIEE